MLNKSVKMLLRFILQFIHYIHLLKTIFNGRSSFNFNLSYSFFYQTLNFFFFVILNKRRLKARYQKTIFFNICPHLNNRTLQYSVKDFLKLCMRYLSKRHAQQTPVANALTSPNYL